MYFYNIHPRHPLLSPPPMVWFLPQTVPIYIMSYYKLFLFLGLDSTDEWDMWCLSVWAWLILFNNQSWILTAPRLCFFIWNENNSFCIRCIWFLFLSLMWWRSDSHNIPTNPEIKASISEKQDIISSWIWKLQ
jgi:hypothetical protein